MYCQVIKPHKSDFDFFKNLKFPLFRHNKEMGPYDIYKIHPAFCVYKGALLPLLLAKKITKKHIEINKK